MGKKDNLSFFTIIYKFAFNNRIMNNKLVLGMNIAFEYDIGFLTSSGHWGLRVTLLFNSGNQFKFKTFFVMILKVKRFLAGFEIGSRDKK